ncbi:MAG: DUF503 domain-containing protein [SAR202 cluster bacterium]|nr:DUF503 domain-containing protein [SAR202 cluster bacterium]
MHIGVGRVVLRLPENQSLKGKRRVVKSLCGRIRSRFNVSVAEIEGNDIWQVATIGFSCTSNSARHAGETVQTVLAFIRANRGEYEVEEEESETLGF